MNDFTAERLRKLLNYDPKTGIFTWRVAPVKWISPGDPAGYSERSAYVRIGIFGRYYRAHRLAWLYVHGEWPPSMIDHINGDPSDNRLANLRVATASQNQGNAKPRKDNAYGTKGVTWHKSHKKWQARIVIDGKQTHLGHFADKQAAIETYRRAAEAQFGEFARSSE